MLRFASAALAALYALGAIHPAPAQHATPRATELVIDQDEDGILSIGYAAPLPGTKDQIGIVLTCEHATATLTAYLYFGAFPDEPVQAAARDPQGKVTRLGPKVKGGPNTGFHDPRIDDQRQARTVLDIAFQTGTLLSNGYNSIWNALTEAQNTSAHQRLTRCAESR